MSIKLYTLTWYVKLRTQRWSPHVDPTNHSRDICLKLTPQSIWIHCKAFCRVCSLPSMGALLHETLPTWHMTTRYSTYVTARMSVAACFASIAQQVCNCPLCTWIIRVSILCTNDTDKSNHQQSNTPPSSNDAHLKETKIVKFSRRKQHFIFSLIFF